MEMRATGIRRRELLQAGSSGLFGLGLADVVARNARASSKAPESSGGRQKPKSVIIVFLTGAASHHDTFDMKPEAASEIRGEFQPIQTKVPGLVVGEHLPQLAARADKYAVLRTLSHSDNNHLMSTHHVLTGTKQPGGFFDKVASRDDWPCYSAGSAFLRPRSDGIPSGVNLPTFLLSGPLTWPGQHAGFLGPKFDPWQIKGDPNRKDFRVESLSLPSGIDVGRLDARRDLLAEVNRQQRMIDDSVKSKRLTNDQELAFSILTSDGFATAFDLAKESEETRNRYGRHTYGQSLLMARRLIESGVPIVQANMGAVQTWDNHSSVFKTLKDRLLPPLDQSVAALIDDLDERGMLDDTLVVMMGEFGRTPKINDKQGRDHWGPCFFGLFAGGGVLGGQVIGKSDEIGAYPVTTAYKPDDVGATIYRALGIDPASEVRDRLNRPVTLNRGEWIRPLYEGTSV